MARNTPSRKVSFVGGLLDARLSNEVGFNGAVVANNVDFTAQNRVVMRPGRTLVTALSDITAVWSDGVNSLVQAGDTLYSIQPNLSFLAIRSSLTTSNQLSAYTSPFGHVYWSNGVDSGTLTPDKADYPFGVERVGDAFAISATASGNMPAGTYGVSLAYVRKDGVVGGASAGIYSVLTKPGALSITIPAPGDASITDVDVYLTRKDGDAFYRYTRVAADSGSLQVIAPVDDDLHVPLATQYMNAVKQWDAIEMHNARLLTAVDGLLIYSEPFAYELHHPVHNYYVLPKPITVMLSVDQGVYVSTTELTYFYRGADIREAALEVAFDYPIVPGTVVTAERSGEEEDSFLWCTPSDGFVLADGSGNASLISKDVVAPTTGAVLGAAYLRKLNGRNHVVTVLRT